MTKASPHGRRGLFIVRLLLLLTLVRGMLYVGLIPPWQHFDEPGHVEYARFVVVERRLPQGLADVNLAIRQEILSSMIEHDFGGYIRGWIPSSLFDPKVPETQFVAQPLYYVLCAVLLCPICHQDIVLQLHALRTFSVLLNVGIVALAYLTARTLFPNDLLVQLGVPLFIVFLPAYTDIMSAVNSDVLANFLFSLLVYLAVIIQREGSSWSRLALLGGGLALGLLTKRTMVSALVIPVLLVLFAGQRRYGSKGVAIMTGSVVCLSVATVGFAVANWNSMPRWITRFIKANPQMYWDSLLNWRRAWPMYQEEVKILAQGFWGNFGWGAYSLEGWILAFPFLLSGLALIGVLWSLLWKPRARALPLWQRQSLLLLLVVTFCVWLITFLRVHPLPPEGRWVYIPRARYTYVAIIPMACLFVWGVRQFLQGQRGHLLGLAIVFGYVMLDSVAFFGHMLPAFFKVVDLTG
jgi:4-amino-4-deoxy-L-arabinose transferase-like glycosyltransferase